MKKTSLVLLLILASNLLFSQNNFKKPYFTGSINGTLAINQDYTLEPDDGEPLLIPGAIFLRLGIGYQFHRRWQASINAGYDHHYRFNINAIPYYGSIRYNIIEKENDNFFAEYSQGKMWRPSQRFENGNYYSFGIGSQITGASRWSTVIKIDFHRKTIADFKNGRLDSISIGFGFTFF